MSRQKYMAGLLRAVHTNAMVRARAIQAILRGLGIEISNEQAQEVYPNNPERWHAFCRLIRESGETPSVEKIARVIQTVGRSGNCWRIISKERARKDAQILFDQLNLSEEPRQEVAQRG